MKIENRGGIEETLNCKGDNRPRDSEKNRFTPKFHACVLAQMNKYLYLFRLRAT